MATPAERDEERRRRLERSLSGEDVRDAARALLAPGEELRELGATDVAFGDRGPLDPGETLAVTREPSRFWRAVTRTTLRKVLFFTLLAPVVLFLALDGIGGSSTLLDRLLGGQTCEGPPGSTAYRMRQALAALRHRADHFILTDQRLLLAERALLADPPRFTPVLSVPRHEVAAARHRPRGPWRRRVELCFTDGSRIVLALPWLEAPPPKRFLAALHR